MSSHCKVPKGSIVLTFILLQEAVQTKWLGPGVAVGCFGVGVIAAYCAIRYWKRPL